MEGTNISDHVLILNEEERTQFLDNFSMEFKKVHDNGYYISFHNYNHMFINNGKIFFTEMQKMRPEDKNAIIEKNLVSFACTAITIHLGNNIKTTPPLHPLSLKEIYSSWSHIPDFDYYKSIIEGSNQGPVYIHEVHNQQKQLGAGQSQTNRKVLSKSLDAFKGASFTNDQQEETIKSMGFFQTMYLVVTLSIFGLAMIALAFFIVYR